MEEKILFDFMTKKYKCELRMDQSLISEFLNKNKYKIKI